MFKDNLRIKKPYKYMYRCDLEHLALLRSISRKLGIKQNEAIDQALEVWSLNWGVKIDHRREYNEEVI